MSELESTTPSRPIVAALLLIGAAAGALVAWSFTSSGKEKLASFGTSGFAPEEMLNKAAETLRNTKDRIVDAVDSSTH